MSVKGVQITSRDREVFTLLQNFPLLAADAIHSHCFPNTSYSAVGRRLKKLVEYGLLKRTTLLGEAHYRYYLCEVARPYLDNERPLKKVNKNHLRHDIELYECLLAIKQVFNKDVSIIPDFELKQFARRSYRTTLVYNGFLQAFRLSFLPDALIVHNNVGYFIEYDRSTIWGVNLFKKLSAYQQFFSTEDVFDYEELSFNELRVIYLCQNESRVNALVNAIEQYTDLDVFELYTLNAWSNALNDRCVFTPNKN